MASQYCFSPTWPIYNQWPHSLAQQGSPHRVDHRQHSLFTTSHNPIFMRSSKDLWKWPCIISTNVMYSVSEFIRCSSLFDKITNWPKTTRKTEIWNTNFTWMRIYMLIYLVWIIMFNSWYKYGMGKNGFKNVEFSLCITLIWLVNSIAVHVTTKSSIYHAICNTYI